MRRIIYLAMALMVIFTGVPKLWASHIDVTDQYDLKMALDYAATANIDTIFLTTSGGVYTTTDTMALSVLEPLVMMAAPGLAEMPILTNSDPNQKVLDILRIYADFTVEGVIFDGGNDVSHGMKYALRCDNDPTRGYTVDPDADITVKNCIFRNFYQDKDPTKDGHVFKVAKVKVGTVRFENCLIDGTGYEAIRLSDTEKWNTTKTCDSLIVENCTFTRCNAEGIRFYADKDTSTADAYVLLQHLTFYNTATRVMYIKNNQNTIVRDIIVANSRLSTHGRDDFIMQVQQKGSTISNVDTFQVTTLDGTYDRDKLIYVAKNGGKGTDKSTIWGFDPKFKDPTNLDLTLMPTSHAYFAGHDGSALGDLNWAKETPTVIPFSYEIQGKGQLQFDPPLQGRSYDPNTTVTITAVPDSGWQFKEWQGDLTGTDNPASITVDAAKHITAVFEQATAIGDGQIVVRSFALQQNYPNPFNPQTTIQYSIPQNSYVQLTVYDRNGRIVQTLVNSIQQAGTYRVRFAPKNLATGVYFYRLTDGVHHAVHKMLFIK